MKFDIFLQNVKYTLPTLSRDRGFTLVAVLINRKNVAKLKGRLDISHWGDFRGSKWPEAKCHFKWVQGTA